MIGGVVHKAARIAQGAGRVVGGAATGGLKALIQESGWAYLGGARDMPTAGVMSYAGKSVSPETAMKLSAAWSCVKSNSQVIGSLPISIQEKQSNGQFVAIEPDIAEILTMTPNPTQTGMEFWEGNASQTQLQGNSYCERLEVGSRLVGLRPLMDVTPRLRTDRRFDYIARENGKSYILPPEKVFHLRGFGAGNGLGLSAIKYGADSLGAAIAADETAGSIFKSGLMAAGILKTEQNLTPEQREQLQGWIEKFVGSKRAGKVMTLEAGLSFDQLNMNPEDAQLLDTRRFQVEDVCRWFGTPPIIVGHAGAGQTMWGSGVEAILLAWRTLGINPQLRRYEARCNRDLMPAGKRGKWFVRWDREAMMEMDSKSTAEFITKLTNSGVMSVDEGRPKVGLPKRGGAADELHAQTALAPLDQLGGKA